MIESTSLNIAEITFSIGFDLSIDKQRFDQVYADFLTNCKKPDVVIQARHTSIPDLTSWGLVFNTGGICLLLNDNSKEFAISLLSNQYQTAVFQPGFKKGEIYIQRNSEGDKFYLVARALLEMMLINVLAMGKGIMLHACAINDGGKGWLFSGVSKSGKSTMSRLWSRRPDIRILNDDRVVLRKQGGSFWISGTPWHGEAGKASSETVPVQGIFVLRHAEENLAVPLNPSDAVTRLLVRSFPPFWNQEGMDYSLGILTELCQALPCFDLGFQPDDKVVDYLRDIMST